MPANFTSGWLGNNERAWHGLGVVTEGTLPAREAFETAEALFTVEKRELQCPVYGFDQISIKPAGAFGVVRTDTQEILGIVSKQYEIVQNEALLRMAEFIREEADMDAVVVLADGAKVAFTATLKGAASDVVPGDTVKRRIVGYLGHDGKTGCGALFTTIRVVCQNTLNFALNNNTARASIHHKSGANADFDKLIQSINCARQEFVEECDLMKEFARTSMMMDEFDEMVQTVYDVEDLGKFRKYQQLRQSLFRGRGTEFASGTVWSAVNAITEVETSPLGKTAAKSTAQFARANFGQGRIISNKALTYAREFVGAV